MTNDYEVLDTAVDYKGREWLLIAWGGTPIRVCLGSGLTGVYEAYWDPNIDYADPKVIKEQREIPRPVPKPQANEALNLLTDKELSDRMIDELWESLSGPSDDLQEGTDTPPEVRPSEAAECGGESVVLRPLSVAESLPETQSGSGPERDGHLEREGDS